MPYTIRIDLCHKRYYKCFRIEIANDLEKGKVGQLYYGMVKDLISEYCKGVRKDVHK
jgi:hypothetical protein